MDGQDQQVTGTVVCTAMGGNMNIAIEGVEVATNVCSQPLGSWQVHGPYHVTVADGQLNLSVTRVSKGDPFLGAIKVVPISNP